PRRGAAGEAAAVLADHADLVWSVVGGVAGTVGGEPVALVEGAGAGVVFEYPEGRGILPEDLVEEGLGGAGSVLFFEQVDEEEGAGPDGRIVVCGTGSGETNELTVAFGDGDAVGEARGLAEEGPHGDALGESVVVP